jgi:hypothetical protein
VNSITTNMAEPAISTKQRGIQLHGTLYTLYYMPTARMCAREWTAQAEQCLSAHMCMHTAAKHTDRREFTTVPPNRQRIGDACLQLALCVPSTLIVLP